MKKKILTLAVMTALGLSAAHADVILYGSIRTNIEYTKNHNSYTSVNPDSRPLQWDEIARNNPGLIPTDQMRYYLPQLEQGSPARSAAYLNNPGWVQEQKAVSGYTPNTYRLQKVRKNGFNIRDFGSRIGLKGSEDLGNGLQAIFLVEFGFNGVEGYGYGEGFKNRLAFVGLKSETLGTITFGRVDAPFKKTAVSDSIDNMHDSFVFGSAMAVNYVIKGGFNTYSGGLSRPDYETVLALRSSGGLHSRIGNTIRYDSPSWNGVSFNTALTIDSPDTEDGIKSEFGDTNRGVDIFTLNVKYKHKSGLVAAIGYLQSDRSGNRGTTGSTYNLSDGDDNLISSYTQDAKLGQQSGSKSVDSRFFAANIGFETDRFKIGIDVATGKGKSENLVRTRYNLTSQQRTNLAGLTSFDRWNYVKADQKATGFDIGGVYYFNEGMNAIKVQLGRMSGTSKESRHNANVNTNRQWLNNLSNNGTVVSLPGSAVNTQTGAWNDHKNTVMSWGIGFEHKLSARTRTWIEYEGARMVHKQIVEWDQPTFTAAGAYASHNYVSGQRRISDRTNRINVGVRHDF